MGNDAWDDLAGGDHGTDERSELDDLLDGLDDAKAKDGPGHSELDDLLDCMMDGPPAADAAAYVLLARAVPPPPPDCHRCHPYR